MSTRRATKPSRPSGIKPVGARSRINMLVYGHPGAGKTTFISTAPNPERCLILRPPTDHTDSIRGSKVQEWEIKDWTVMLEALEYLRDSQGDGWDWVWLDSISLFQDTGLDDLWAAAIAKKAARAEYGLDKQEYGINMFRLAQWVRHMVGSGYFNFGVTAHPAVIPDPEDEEGMRDILMPYVQGKNMSPKICGYMNIVGYLRVARTKEGKRVRVLDTNFTEQWYGKDQFNALPNGRMVNPSLAKLQETIDGAAPARTTKKSTRRA